MTRRLFLDDGPGEARGVVTLHGRPERLLIRRITDKPEHQPGARLFGRVRTVDRALGIGFIDLGSEPDGVVPLTGEGSRLAEGARIEIEVVAPPRLEKGPVVRVIGPAEGAPGLLVSAPGLEAQLAACAPGVPVVGGPQAREAADLAEETALAAAHRLASGGTLWIEPTRALVAIDVDVGSAIGDARRAATRANREAIMLAATLLRLKGLGGPIVFDLAGKGHDGEALKTAAEAAFSPNQPGVAFGPISRFGLWPLVLPRREVPTAERLCDPAGRLTVESLSFRLLRAIEAAAGPGQRVEARAALSVAAVATSLRSVLLDRIGPRFHIEGDPDLDLESFEIRAA